MVDHPQQEHLQKSVLTPEEVKKRNQRNLALALGLGAFVITVFLVTMLRLGASVAERSF